LLLPPRSTLKITSDRVSPTFSNNLHDIHLLVFVTYFFEGALFQCVLQRNAYDTKNGRGIDNKGLSAIDFQG